MSERGSFCTQYIYCDKCFKAAKSVLIGREKHLCSTTIQSWVKCSDELPIIAGKIGGLYPGEEIHAMESMIEDLEKLICHPIRIAVLAESGESILTANPVGQQG